MVTNMTTFTMCHFRQGFLGITKSKLSNSMESRFSSIKSHFESDFFRLSLFKNIIKRAILYVFRYRQTYLTTIGFCYSFAICTCRICTQQNNLSATHFFSLFSCRYLHNMWSQAKLSFRYVAQNLFSSKNFSPVAALQLWFSMGRGSKRILTREM